MNDDFMDFLSSSGKIPENLQNDTKDLLVVSLRPKRTLSKYYGLQLIGMFLTLFVCPQYGFYSEGNYLIMNLIMEMGPLFCGFLCSSIFFTGALLMSSIFMSKSELRWVTRNQLTTITPFYLMIFILMMLTKDFQIDHLQSPVHDFVWLLTAYFVGFGGIAFVGMMPKMRMR